MATAIQGILGALNELVRQLPSVDYGEEKFNRWGKPTATINWCEEDYVVTPYCAEFVNSITNVIFMYLAIRGMRNCLHEGHDKIFFISFLGFFGVGLGSFLFHSTLWYSMQLVDELSMIYTTCLMAWASFCHGRSLRYSAVVGALLSSVAGGVSVYYHYLQDPTFHQNVFALLTAGVLFRSFYMMERYVRPVDAASVNRMWKLVGSGVGVFLGGFVLWNLDNAFCGSLRSWRRSVGMPWGWLAEGHGWWHLLTGVGAYFQLQYGVWLRYCLDGRQREFALAWPSIFSFPDVVKVEEAKPGGRQNGGGAIYKKKV